MSLLSRIVIVNNLDECIPQRTSVIKKTDESDVIYLLHNKDAIMKYLIKSSDENEVDIIIVISDTDSPLILDSIKKVINRKVAENIATVVLQLEQKLRNIIDGVICGIRHKTLIIKMCCSFKIAIKCIEKCEALILEIFKLITKRNDYTSIFFLNNNNIQKYIKMEANHTKKSYVSVTEAQKLIRNVIIQSNEEIESECVSVRDAYGRILLDDIYSKCNVPSFRASAKHGYAIKANEETNRKKILKAGTSSLEPNTCVWVKTGAPMPCGATAVVQIKNIRIINKKHDTVQLHRVISSNDIENLIHNSDNNSIEEEENTDNIEEEIEIIIHPKEGENMRFTGSERKIGDKILNKYTRIGPPEIGLLASCGWKEVTVIKLPSIGILSMEDKLEEPGKPLRSKHVYDGNRLTLITLLKQEGFNALDFGIMNCVWMPSTLCKITDILDKINVLVITSNTNDNDNIKLLLEECFEATIHFDCVNVKPGKSTIYATCKLNNRQKYFFHLSGNPANVLTVAHLFLLPFLNQMRRNISPVIIPTCLMNAYTKPSRPSFIWTHLKWDPEERDTFPRAYIVKTLSLFKSHKANALLMLPAIFDSEISLRPGTFVPALFLDSK
ncbi:gephyrin-like [Nylanderia fulva]|uniref:gephyrin-like n=1 Tax=Nylanderia fulva TaxID=613905 RepID=UPI0010FBB45E|nr:gephyrin-like [Nylanderia fulva]